MKLNCQRSKRSCSLAYIEAGKMNSEETGEETLLTDLSQPVLWSVTPCVDELLIIAE